MPWQHYHFHRYTTLCRSGEVEQNTSSHFVGGGKDDRTKVGGPAITVPVHVPVNVYSPAHDPDFLSGLKPAKQDTLRLLSVS